MLIQELSKGEAHVGDILIYKLRKDQLPVDAHQTHHGTITHILVDIQDSAQKRYYIVLSIDCLGYMEIVLPEQVVGFEPREV